MSRCWRSNVEFAESRHGDNSPEYRHALHRPATCLLPQGHAGPHEFTFDGDVRFTFSVKPSPRPNAEER